MTIAIIGLGLIGGSFAKAIKERTKHRVVGFDRNEVTLRKALQSDAINAVCSDLSSVDITLIALYPDAAVDFIKQNAKNFKKGSTVIDLCGIKRYVCHSLRGVLPENVTFIGGHPMAGRECSGFENSIPTMFDGASMILTPDEDILLDDMEDLAEFFTSLGFGHIEVTDDERHDQMIAYTSQLAHIVSSAYVRDPSAKNYIGFSAGSFYDMTRVAKLNEEMWTELFLHNGDYLQQHLQTLIDNLISFNNALSRHDAKAVCDMLREGREMKELLESL